jgi:hypothetical protein
MFEGDQSPRTQERFDALPVVCWNSDMRGFNHGVNHNPQLGAQIAVPDSFQITVR